MMIRVVLALTLCAGSSERTTRIDSTRFAVVPDAMLEKLGEFGVGLAVDFHAFDTDRLGALIPDRLGCLRDLLKMARVGVVTFAADDWEGHITGLDQTRTCECLGKLGPVLGFDFQHIDTAYRLGIPEKPLELTWQGDDAAIVLAGHQHHKGEPPVVIQGLLSKIPHGAKAWLVSSGLPQYKIKSAVVYLETTIDTFTFTATAEGIEQGAAQPWIEGVVRGFRKTAEEKGIHIEDSWIVIESTSMKTTLIATIPTAKFAPR